MDLPDPLVAPARLTAETRAEFRARALERVEQVSAKAASRIVIDVGATTEIDATGLAILVYVEKCARDRGVETRLANAGPAVRNPLLVARLGHLFELT